MLRRVPESGRAGAGGSFLARKSLTVGWVPEVHEACVHALRIPWDAEGPSLVFQAFDGGRRSRFCTIGNEQMLFSPSFRHITGIRVGLHCIGGLGSPVIVGMVPTVYLVWAKMRPVCRSYILALFFTFILFCYGLLWSILFCPFCSALLCS